MDIPTLHALDPKGSWASHLQPLDPSKDLHLPRREVDDSLDDGDKELLDKRKRFRGCKQSKNKQELSWIWCAQHAGGRPRRVTSADEVNEYSLFFPSNTHLLISL